MLSLERQEEYRRRYEEMRPDWRPSSHVYQAMVAARLTPQTIALDLGCGRGGVMERLHSQTGSVVGVDPDLLSLREHRLPSLPRAQALSERLPFSDASFDLVCASWVLEHLPLPGRTFAEIARVLRPGGWFVFLTPNAHHPLLLLNRLLHWTQGRLVSLIYDRTEEDTFPAFYRANTLRRIRALAREAGLTCTTLETIADPTYLAFNDVLFRLSARLTPLLPSALRVHLAGECRKSQTAS